VVETFVVHITHSQIDLTTSWSGSVGTDAHLSGQLASFSALTLLVGSSVKIVLEMSCYASTRLQTETHRDKLTTSLGDH